jgi:hypothetical protein
MSDRYKETARGIELLVKVIPKASRSEIVGWEAHLLKVRLAAVPEKGQANAELIKYLAKLLGIAKSRIELLSGETARQKRILLVGFSLDEVRAFFKPIQT